jgi:hypothetical protein
MVVDALFDVATLLAGSLPRRPVRHSAGYNADPFSAVEAAAPALILPLQQTC